MSKENQILLLRLQAFSQPKIVDMLHVPRSTVARVFQTAAEVPMPEDNIDLQVHRDHVTYDLWK